MSQFLALRNGTACGCREIPLLEWPEFRRAILDSVAGGARVAALFGHLPDATAPVELYLVLADRAVGQLFVAKTRIAGDVFPSLTTECPQVHLFEREIAEQFALRPEGHPWLKPVRFVSSQRTGHDAWNRPDDQRITVGVTDFYRVEGGEIHEVAVGPIHAGVIEPGHFRFQCHGEQVFHLEISLGYQHRGVERALIGGPTKRTIRYMETLAGDTTVGHATAYCQAVEALAGCKAPARAQGLRGVALELERLANHTGDLGALAGDVGFLPTASYCGRLRGDFLNMTARLCGSRFGRGLVRPGGVAFDVEQGRAAQLLANLETIRRDVASAVNLLWDSSSVMNRLEETGKLSLEICERLGLVGPAARACGAECDVRHDFPSGIYRFSQIPVSTAATGDVFARAYVRWLEIQRSADFVREQLQMLAEGSTRKTTGDLAPDKFVVSLVEGWRGMICHAAMTDQRGRFARYKVVDPSFYNWTGLALALRNQQVSDFPLCNKSFNLSYCGHDL
ncbi:MAG TPA: hydrogenase [Verrucomicrobiae bacterium]|nr:hydrogenase [Verrucomicrobiae bacterium]